jgi:hypothetical protein
MKRRKNPSLIAHPDDPVSIDEIRVFASLLLPIYECEWQRAVTSPQPNWTYLLHLHMRLIQLEQGDL